MVINISQVVDRAIQEKPFLLEVIHQLNGGNSSATDKLKRLFPGDFERELFAWNASQLRKISTYDNLPYMLLPASASICAQYAIPEDDVHKTKAVRKAMSHGIFDKAVGYSFQRLVTLIRENPKFQD